MVVIVGFPSLSFLGGEFLLPVFLWMQLPSLGWGFPSSTFCMAGFVDTCCLNLFFVMKALLGIVIWVCIHGLFVTAAHLSMIFRFSWFPLRTRV